MSRYQGRREHLGRHSKLTMTKSKPRPQQAKTEPTEVLPPVVAIEPPLLEFTPHRQDPRLTMTDAGRLVGCCYMTIRRRIEAGLIEHEVDAVGKIRVRQSEILRHFGIAGRFRQSAYFWVQQSQLPYGYKHQSHYPQPRRHESVTYFPVPIQDMINNGKT